MQELTLIVQELTIIVQKQNNKINGAVRGVDDRSHGQNTRASVNTIHKRFCRLLIRQRRIACKLIKLGPL